MMRPLYVISLVFAGSLAWADVIVPVKTIRANTVLTADLLTLNSNLSGPGLSDMSQAIGLETRVMLYAGRPIRAEDLIQPALVERNALVPIVFQQSGLTITTLGRALDRGAAGDTVRVMNASSRNTLFGTVLEDGRIFVSER